MKRADIYRHLELMKEIGFDYDVWKPAGRRVYRFIYNGVVVRHCSSTADMTTYVDGVLRGNAIGRTQGRKDAIGQSDAKGGQSTRHDNGDGCMKGET